MRVLVVDDFRPIVDMLIGVLLKHGYEARAAYSAKEAIDIAETFAPHALIIDVLLKDGNGFEVADKCEQRFPTCRVLLMSAWDFERELEKVPEGFNVVNKSVLIAKVFEFLDECASLQ
jgi:DNA-binding response OmpR family regulator